MNQHVDAALRRALERTAEGLDDNPDRYAQVAARAKRRRQRQALGGVVAAVLLATAAVALATGWLGADQTGQPAGSLPDIDCPATIPPVLPVPEPTAEQSGPLVPEGPVAVRVCGLLDNVMLEHDLDRLVAAMNALDPAPSYRDLTCTADWSPDYQLVFVYPDGNLVTATLEQGSCRGVLVGDQLRIQPPGQLIADLLDELAEA